jgi:hypothetical protein
MNETLFQILVLTALLWQGISIQRLIKKQTMAQATLDDLTQDVSDETTVEQSAITLLQGLSAQLAAAKNDPTKIQAIADSIVANKNALAAAITANTPAA